MDIYVQTLLKCFFVKGSKRPPLHRLRCEYESKLHFSYLSQFICEFPWMWIQLHDSWTERASKEAVPPASAVRMLTEKPADLPLISLISIMPLLDAARLPLHARARHVRARWPRLRATVLFMNRSQPATLKHRAEPLSWTAAITMSELSTLTD